MVLEIWFGLEIWLGWRLVWVGLVIWLNWTLVRYEICLGWTFSWVLCLVGMEILLHCVGMEIWLGFAGDGDSVRFCWEWSLVEDYALLDIWLGCTFGKVGESGLGWYGALLYLAGFGVQFGWVGLDIMFGSRFGWA